MWKKLSASQQSVLKFVLEAAKIGKRNDFDQWLAKQLGHLGHLPTKIGP